MKDTAAKALDERLAQLPREVAPPKDLWPRVASEIARPARSRHRYALAAAAATLLVCLTSALTFAVLRAQWPAAGHAAPLAQNPPPNFGEPSNPALVAARAELEKTFRERLAALDPQTRAHIVASLAVIRKAHSDIADELAGTPGSPVLEQLLASTWHDEFDLYDDVVRSTQPTLARN